MTVLITDPAIADRLKAECELSDGGRFDEVWEDVYMKAPLPDDEHQDIQAKLTAVFQTAVGWTQFAQVRAGANVSDREAGWERAPFDRNHSGNRPAMDRLTCTLW